MAAEDGGAYDDQPWHGAQPPYPGQSGPGGLRDGRLARQASRRARKRLRIAVIVVLLGVAGLAISLPGLITQLLPRQFTAGQKRQITDWEYGARWRELPAGTIFPASVRYAPPMSLSDDLSLVLTVRRVGIARQADCRAATDPAAATVLDRDGCTVVLRATYVDETDSYVVTVGAAVMPGTARAKAAAKELAAARGGGRLPGVRTVQFGNTPAASFTDPRRQLSGAIAGGTYVFLYTVGYADTRPMEPVATDSYTDAEMASAGMGTARAVLFVLAAPVPAPRCPGTPGC